jgi:hypothetical protein
VLLASASSSMSLISSTVSLRPPQPLDRWFSLSFWTFDDVGPTRAAADRRAVDDDFAARVVVSDVAFIVVVFVAVGSFAKSTVENTAGAVILAVALEEDEREGVSREATTCATCRLICCSSKLVKWLGRTKSCNLRPVVTWLLLPEPDSTLALVLEPPAPGSTTRMRWRHAAW